MSLSNASVLTFLLGLCGLALLLYALQWLRVRHRRVAVVTTLFWKEAIEESRARVLFKRFRHPWAYLLALAIVGLIWLAWAGPERATGNETETVLLVDGSAGMALGTRFEAALAVLRRAVHGLPSAQRRVFWCGSDTRLLLDRGEEALLLDARLAGLQPEASPGGLDRACLTLAEQLRGRSARFVLVGAAPVSEAVRNLLPESVTLQRLVTSTAPSATGPTKPNNAGIRALGLAPSLEQYEAVDAYVRTSVQDAVFQFRLADAPFEPDLEAVGEGEWILRGVPAEGGELAVNLVEADALQVDNSASIQLPRRERIRVALAENVPAVLVRLVRSDPALEIVETDPVVWIGPGEDALPALRWAPRADQEDAFVFTGEENGVALEIDSLFTRLGMDQIDATSLAQTSGAVIRLSVEPGAVRSITLWDSLLTNEFNLIQSAAFPLFVAQALRWLAEVDPVDPYVSVAEIHPRLTIGGAPYAPPRVGDYADRTGRIWTASLQDDPLAAADEVPRVTTLSGSVSGSAWITGLLFGALALLVLEWILYQKGRMP